MIYQFFREFIDQDFGDSLSADIGLALDGKN
jgi:hypothetical protein